MKHQVPKKNCCGCGACISACPTESISLLPDKEGFLYPKIDEGKCIQCGKCISVCPFSGDNQRTVLPLQIYGAWSLDEQVRFQSSSGGLFTEIARYILSLKGIVFGAIVEKGGTVAHHYITQESEITKICKSKYVQSNVGTSYTEVKCFLESGKIVLFSGTPCQILALHNFLGKEYSTLYTVDVICVGVPSPKVWKAYLEEIEKENHSKVRNVIFRHKEIDNAILKAGNRNLTIKIEFENGRVLYEYCDKNEFFGGFLSKLFLRPSCGECKAKNFSSGSDMQLGDFWEIEKIYPEVLSVVNERRIPFGISEVLIYSEKGKELFNAISRNITFFQANIQLVKKVQADTNWFLLENSSQQHWNRKKFFEEFGKTSVHVKELIRRYLSLRNVEYMAGKVLGMWGSFRLRESIRFITNHTDCKLEFQFRASTIYSLMSEGKMTNNQVLTSRNPFRDKMMKADMKKEFRLNMELYLKNIDFFVFDLLEERYDNMLWNGIVLTKSEGYFENENIQGMPLEISFEKWKVNAAEFITLLQSYIDISRIIMVENYLYYKYGTANAPKYVYTESEYLDAVNSLLRMKYNYIKNAYPEIKVISDISEDWQFTEKAHMYGCIPEHANYGVYSYIAQEIIEICGKADDKYDRT